MVRTGAVMLAALVAMAGQARADACYDHNGSEMRLEEHGSMIQISYLSPKAVLSRAGVVSGTLLFEGEVSQGRVSGTARTFSRFCPGLPNEYPVEGVISKDGATIVLEGTRQTHERCVFDGGSARDTLVFTYLRDC